MSKAQVIHKLRPPSAIHWQGWHAPDSAPREVRLRHIAVSVNFANTYHCGGISHSWIVSPCPVVTGFGGIGIVEGVGLEIKPYKTGPKL